MSAERATSRSQKILGGTKDDLASLAKTAMSSFERMWGGIRVLDRDHPNRKPYFEQFLDNIKPVFDQADVLRLGVEPYSFTLNDQELITVDRPNENYVYRLYQDGIRQLSFTPDVTAEEVEQFVGILETVTTSVRNLEDDIVTLMWEAEFAGIGYENIEGFVAGEEGDTDADHDASSTQIDDVMSFATSAVPITDDDIDLSELISRKKSYAANDSNLRDHADELLEGVREDKQKGAEDVFSFSPEEQKKTRAMLKEGMSCLGAKFGEIAFITFESLGDKAIQIIPKASYEFGLDCIDDCRIGPLHQAVSIIEGCGPGVEGDYIRNIILVSLAHPDLIDGLLDMAANDATNHDLVNLLSLLGQGAFRIFWDRSSNAANSNVRKLLKQIIELHAPGHQSFLFDRLREGEQEEALRALSALRKTDVKKQATKFIDGLKHPAPKVRFETMSVLRKSNNPEVRKAMQGMLDDLDETIRSAAIQILVRAQGEAVEGHFIMLIKASDFAARSKEEKKRIISSLGKIATEEGLMTIREIALGLSAIKVDKETRIQAIRALGDKGSPEDLARIKKIGRSILAPKDIKAAARKAATKIDGRSAG